MKHLTKFALVATFGAALVAACTQAPQTAPAGSVPVMTDANGILVVSARLSGVARRVQAMPATEPTLLSDIQTLRVVLLDSSRAMVTEQKYANPDLVTPLAFRNLRANTKYFIRAEAYLVPMASATPGQEVASAETAATVTPDDINPTVAELTLQLASQPFNSEAENVVEIVPGTWIYEAEEEIATRLNPLL